MAAAANNDYFSYLNSTPISHFISGALSYNDKLADKITLLAGQIDAANFQFLKYIAEFDRLEAWADLGVRSCAHWLDLRCGIALGAAREKVRVARALEGMDNINEAFSKGELSYSKVRAMTRVATKENKAYLLMIAQYGTAQQLEKLTGVFCTVCYHDECEGDLQHERVTEEYVSEQSEQIMQEQQRAVNYYQDDDGMWVIDAKLPAEEGGLLVKLLQALGE